MYKNIILHNLGNIMKKLLFVIIFCFATTAPALSGEYANALSQCLTANTTESDKGIMARWVYSTLSQHPSINSMSALTSDATTRANRDMAQLVETFVYSKCKTQVKNTLQNEGPKAIEDSIRVYAQTTGQEILKDPSISNSVTNLAQQLDLMKLFQALMTD